MRFKILKITDRFDTRTSFSTPTPTYNIIIQYDDYTILNRVYILYLSYILSTNLNVKIVEGVLHFFFHFFFPSLPIPTYVTVPFITRRDRYAGVRYGITDVRFGDNKCSSVLYIGTAGIYRCIICVCICA